MIKLERIELLFQVQTGTRGLSARLTRKDDGDIEWDPATQTVRLPIQDRPVLPIAGNVRIMIPVRLELICPECDKKGYASGFEHQQALASHRYQKHGVQGTTRKQREA